MKIDPYNYKEKYLNWKNKVLKEGLPDISKENFEIILQYVIDMELGLNVASVSKKGSRSYIRLNSIKQGILFLTKEFEKRYNIKNITQVKEMQLHDYFSSMRNGTITKQNEAPYKDVANSVKNFKAFWHWYQKINRKKGIEIADITIDLDTRKSKPEWVYLDEIQIKRLCESAKYSYKVLIMFLFDTGIRSPTELVNSRDLKAFEKTLQQSKDNGQIPTLLFLYESKNLKISYEFLLIASSL